MKINTIKGEKLCLYEAVLCNKLYGTVEQVTHKVVGIYVLPNNVLLGSGGVPPSLIKEKIGGCEYVYYELHQFIKELSKGNPDAIDALFAFNITGIAHNEAFDLLYTQKDKFLTDKCKHTFGWSSLVKLIENSKPELTIRDFIHIVPGPTLDVLPLSEHLPKMEKDRIKPEHFNVEHLIGDVYKYYVSYFEANMGKNLPKEVMPSTGIEISGSMLKSRKITKDEENLRKLYNKGLLYFDSAGYEAYKLSKPVRLSNEERLLCYIRVKSAELIGKTGKFNLPQRSEQYGLETNIKEGSTGILVDSVLKLWGERIENAWKDHVNPVVKEEEFKELELYIRQRFTLVSEIEKEH